MSESLEEKLIRRLGALGYRDVEVHIYAGVPFLYLCAPKETLPRLTSSIRRAALPPIRNHELTFECRYVRRCKNRWVFRFRFRVPDQKSFCCGNRCSDCILQRPWR
ncbi:hypothetical protein [Kroppenstedtia eburnea]|uniref:Uncharacterized protein n=1 Tax=Kroppenstedtia eburnea TaxID=714067 RepID=A0A1N7KI55_9BACL|nr:hypothetical protein [Kroppenstedtia eburnea]EGK11987.1 hypothetical protein HMPREF9374_1688 [Desmospora sp. 8437]QKI82978.1 hypothetical protein GXN75_13780 [Kroppenstedtia eburnea]SIS61120.1 hypothetical protein SAMN05421790_10380 [Kroppenstedtia eburnea]